MFDIEKILADYGLTPERYEELLKDCSDKVAKVSDLDWVEINNKYGIEFNSDTSRKGAQPPLFGGVFVKEYFELKNRQNKYQNDNSYMKELQIKKDEIYKAKRKLYDQRREYNKLLSSDARAEHLCDELIKVANKLNEEKPIIFEEKWFKPNIHKEAVLCLADWHYCMVNDNIWNTYNTSICRQRVKQLV